ncbi:MAG: preprotein translocase subunit SecG [Deltaproteobacteria bacterium]|nr:preprotein translocase subunit SecG [Deltaproteobacteria bacterium]
MLTFVTAVHVFLCVFMIAVILLQPGKDAGMGALSGGSATSAFGGRGAVTVLSKVTAVSAALFFMTSLGLSFAGMKGSVMTAEVANKAAAAAAAAAAADAGTPAPAEQTQQGTEQVPAAAADAGTP